MKKIFLIAILVFTMIWLGAMHISIVYPEPILGINTKMVSIFLFGIVLLIIAGSYIEKNADIDTTILVKILNLFLIAFIITGSVLTIILFFGVLHISSIPYFAGGLLSGIAISAALFMHIEIYG